MAVSCGLRQMIGISSHGCLSELPIIRLSNGWSAAPATGASGQWTGRPPDTRKRRRPPGVRLSFCDFSGSSGADHNILAALRRPLYLLIIASGQALRGVACGGLAAHFLL